MGMEMGRERERERGWRCYEDADVCDIVIFMMKNVEIEMNIVSFGNENKKK